jgi:hypothetical protein
VKNARDFGCGLPSSLRSDSRPQRRLNLKSAGAKGLWGFDSPSRHQLAYRRRAWFGVGRGGESKYNGWNTGVEKPS